jgi:hypothetical protein
VMKRIVIDGEALWAHAIARPDGMRSVYQWLRLHSIDPQDVPIDSDLVMEDSAFGPVIRYSTLLRNADGRRYVDPEDPDRAARAQRTAPLRALPDQAWPATRGGDA